MADTFSAASVFRRLAENTAVCGVAYVCVCVVMCGRRDASCVVLEAAAELLVRSTWRSSSADTRATRLGRPYHRAHLHKHQSITHSLIQSISLLFHMNKCGPTGTAVCLLAAPRIQLFLHGAGSGWPHNALPYHLAHVNQLPPLLRLQRASGHESESCKERYIKFRMFTFTFNSLQTLQRIPIVM